MRCLCWFANQLINTHFILGHCKDASQSGSFSSDFTLGNYGISRIPEHENVCL